MLVQYDLKTRDLALTHSASARRRGGDWFESRPDTASQLKTLKMVPAAAISGARHKGLEYGNALAHKPAQIITVHSQTKGVQSLPLS